VVGTVEGTKRGLGAHWGAKRLKGLGDNVTGEKGNFLGSQPKPFRTRSVLRYQGTGDKTNVPHGRTKYLRVTGTIRSSPVVTV